MAKLPIFLKLKTRFYTAFSMCLSILNVVEITEYSFKLSNYLHNSKTSEILDIKMLEELTPPPSPNMTMRG